MNEIYSESRYRFSIGKPYDQVGPYTESEFHEISTKLPERDGIKPEDAEYITSEVWRTSKGIRDVVRLGDVCKKDRSKLDLWVRLMRKY